MWLEWQKFAEILQPWIHPRGCCDTGFRFHNLIWFVILQTLISEDTYESFLKIYIYYPTHIIAKLIPTKCVP